MKWQQHLARAASSVESAQQLVQGAGSGTEVAEQEALDAVRLLESAADSLRLAAMSMREARRGVGA